ncbi:MAG: zinc-ribbon domain-containing protein [Micavibrio aeruginosavorus]|nr:zinc-ribbon domain-containing protein [Micavibrio aeruginosavorus]
MIITCEKCNARYLLASLLLGAAGRKVRCGVCGHTWFQPPVDDMLSPDAADDGERPSFHAIMDEEDMEPIPEGVKPIPEGSSVPALTPGAMAVKVDRAAANGLLAAAVIVLFFGGMVAARGAVVQAWQPAALFFEKIGLPVMVQGEGLIFDQVSAKATTAPDGSARLVVQGNIINLYARESALPPIRATLRKSESEPGDSWIIAMDRNSIGPEEVITFETRFENLPGEMQEVNLRFEAK